MIRLFFPRGKMASLSALQSIISYQRMVKLIAIGVPYVDCDLNATSFAIKQGS